MAYGDATNTDQAAPTGEPGKIIPRERPEPDEARKKQVEGWLKRIADRRTILNDGPFKAMREDQDWADGLQVKDATGTMVDGTKADQYVCDFTQRHVTETTDLLYAKNPTAIAKRVQRIDSATWDGTAETAQEVDKRMALAITSGQQPDPADLQFMDEVAGVLAQRKMIDNIGKTMVLLFNYYLKEGNPPFKTRAKQLIAAVQTMGCGYVKLGFQRLMGPNNEIEEQIADFSRRLKYIEALAADMADGEFTADDAEAQELKEAIEALQQQGEVIIREGLVFDFPGTTSIIPGPGCVQIVGFVGAPWIAEEHIVSPEEVKERFSVDLGKGDFTAHHKLDDGSPADEDMCRWYEVYDLKAGVVRHLVEGYCDYLEEPKAPEVFFEQGHPYFALAFRLPASRRTCFPRSDVRLIRSMQVEYNRAREGLRKHRIANRPAYVTLAGAVAEDDLDMFQDHDDMEILVMKAPPGTDLSKILVAKPTIDIDDKLYDTEFVYTDMQRVVGTQAANLGGTTDATATEASIAEGSRQKSTGSSTDQLDDFLTGLARASGQLMLAELSPDTVKKIAGDGAVWPELTKTQIAEELFLEVKAGSSGAPNNAQELANFERAAPFILQIPGISPKKLGEYVLTRLDTGIDLDEWQVEDLPSIMSINAMAKQMAQTAAPVPPGAGGGDPNAQGDQGANNEEQPFQGDGGPQPAYPAPNDASRVMPPSGMLQ